MLRRIFGLQSKEGAIDWRNMHNEKLHIFTLNNNVFGLCPLSNVSKNTNILEIGSVPILW
jgi:hypothetical protein